MKATEFALMAVGAIIGAGVMGTAARGSIDALTDTIDRLRGELARRRHCPLCGDDQ